MAKNKNTRRRQPLLASSSVTSARDFRRNNSRTPSPEGDVALAHVDHPRDPFDPDPSTLRNPSHQYDDARAWRKGVIELFVLQKFIGGNESTTKLKLVMFVVVYIVLFFCNVDDTEKKRASLVLLILSVIILYIVETEYSEVLRKLVQAREHISSAYSLISPCLQEPLRQEIEQTLTCVHKHCPKLENKCALLEKDRVKLRRDCSLFEQRCAQLDREKLCLKQDHEEKVRVKLRRDCSLFKQRCAQLDREKLCLKQDLEEMCTKYKRKCTEFEKSKTYTWKKCTELEKKCAQSENDMVKLKQKCSQLEEEKKQLSAKLVQEQDRLVCVVCLYAKRTLVLKPCSHFCVCVDCAEHVYKKRECPICKGHISTNETETVYMT